MGKLAGKRVLIVEDEYFIAAYAADMIESAGGTPIGPCGSVAEALDTLQRERVDAALLDFNLNGQASDPVAAALRAKGVPFIVATGYGRSSNDEEFVLAKPYTESELHQEFDKLLAP